MSGSNQKGNESENVVRKRRWRSSEERRAIAEASLKPGSSLREVAEEYGVHPSQVGKWRRLYRKGALGSTAAMLAVRVTDDVQAGHPSRSSKSKVNGHGMIHIEFARARVSIEGMVDAATLRAVLASLAG